MSTPTNPPAKHPPRRFVMKHWNLPGRHDVGSAFLSARQAGGEPCDEYLSLQEHTAIVQEEKARAVKDLAEKVKDYFRYKFLADRGCDACDGGEPFAECSCFAYDGPYLKAERALRDAVEPPSMPIKMEAARSKGEGE